MKAAMLYGIKDLRVEDIETPSIGSREVLVKVKTATTCGTDLKIMQRGYVEKVIKLPTVFGHEWAGDVVDVGKDLSWPEKGMRVRAGNSAPCLHCRMCQKGKYNLCENMTWLWGAYAEYIRVPAQTVLVNMQEIPQHARYEEAALTEPLACVLHGAEEAMVKLGDSVAIIGAGPIGLLHLLVAKKKGAEKTIVIDMIDERLDCASRLGADAIVNAARENVAERVKQLTSGYGADIVIEAIGLPATWEQAMKLASKGGTILEFGGCPPNTEVRLNAEAIHYGEQKVMGAFHATPLHFRKALDLIASKIINVNSLITREMPLEKIKEAFDVLANTKTEIKIAIKP